MGIYIQSLLLFLLIFPPLFLLRFISFFLLILFFSPLRFLSPSLIIPFALFLAYVFSPLAFTPIQSSPRFTSHSSSSPFFVTSFFPFFVSSSPFLFCVLVFSFKLFFHLCFYCHVLSLLPLLSFLCFFIPCSHPLSRLFSVSLLSCLYSLLSLSLPLPSCVFFLTFFIFLPSLFSSLCPVHFFPSSFSKFFSSLTSLPS